MRTFLLWFMKKVGDCVEFMLSIHILGNLSLLHFVLGAALLALLLRFLHFGTDSVGEGTSRLNAIYNREENRLDKLEYKRAREKERSYVPRHASGRKHGYQDDRYYDPRHGRS